MTRHLARNTFAVAVLALSGLEASAALQEHYQRRNELADVVKNNDVQDRLGETPIDSVRWVSDGLYEVKAGPCTLEVRLVSLPADEQVAGPWDDKLEVGQPECIER